VSDAAPAKKRPIYRYDLASDEIAELGELLPDEVTAHHLRWLETGEGDPWPESSG
jgi:hypothetical protein